MLAPLALFPVFQPVQAAAGLQPKADGPAEIQLAAMTAPLALGGELSVDLLGNALDQGNGLGDLRILELGDIPVEQAQLRIRLHTTGSHILQAHLLLQNGPGEDGVDKIVVKPRIAGHIILVFFHEVPQPLTVFFSHCCVGLQLLLRQVHGLAVELQLLLRPLPLELNGLLLLSALLRPGPDGLLGEEKSVKDPVKGDLLLPGLGIDHPQGVFYLLPVFQP